MEAFEKICKELCNLYEKKNHDYGNSFGMTFKELGIISAITRISDKFHRLVNLTTKVNAQVDDESLEDTLKDLASYSIMTLAEIRKAEEIPTVTTTNLPFKEVWKINSVNEVRKND